MKNIIIDNKQNCVLLFLVFFLLSSCTKDLDIVPKDDDDFTSEVFYQNPNSYKQFLAKIYGGLALTGQSNVAGSSDLGSGAGTVDEGFSQYLRGYWQLQELPTDEALIAWGDPTIPDLNTNTWNADNVFTEAFFARIFFQIGLCNEFLRETTDSKLSERGVTDELRTQIKMFRAEVRFLRALSYYHGLDIFGKIPFGTDADLLGTPPPMKNREFVFDYVLSELDAINYAKCVGLTMLSWDFPLNKGIKENIDTYGLYPVTVLTNLTLKEKHQLIENDIVLVKELYKSSNTLKKIGVSEIKIKRIFEEIRHLCKI